MGNGIVHCGRLFMPLGRVDNGTFSMGTFLGAPFVAQVHF